MNWQVEAGLTPPGMSGVLQAQDRMQESSQKVDLLGLSLERCLAALPRDHPSGLQDELSAAASPSPKKQCGALSSSCTSSFFRPASLTGFLYEAPSHEHQQCGDVICQC